MVPRSAPDWGGPRRVESDEADTGEVEDRRLANEVDPVPAEDGVGVVVAMVATIVVAGEHDDRNREIAEQLTGDLVLERPVVVRDVTLDDEDISSPGQELLDRGPDAHDGMGATGVGVRPQARQESPRGFAQMKVPYGADLAQERALRRRRGRC
jgi:hypothetical protein